MKRYIVMALSAVFIAGLFLFGLARVSIAYTEALNEKYKSAYESGERGISSPWYEKGYHVVDESFINTLGDFDEAGDDLNIISLGSSLSRISFLKKEAKAPDGYRYAFLVCGNGCYKSDRQLYELYRLNRNNENDYIKLEVSYSTFRSMNTSITETILDKWGKYSIDEDGKVKENTVLLTPVYALNKELIRVQNSWELLYDAANQYLHRGDDSEEIIPGNFRNNYFNYETVADGIYIQPEIKDDFSALIKEIAESNHLIIEISPMPNGLAQTENGQEFVSYVDNELLPYLMDNEITYFDYRNEFSDDEFCDGVHLGYKAAVKYTQQLNEDLNGVING